MDLVYMLQDGKEHLGKAQEKLDCQDFQGRALWSTADGGPVH